MHTHAATSTHYQLTIHPLIHIHICFNITGMGDIETLSDLFSEATSPHGFEFLVIGIHSQLPFETQMAAFEATEANVVKVRHIHV